MLQQQAIEAILDRGDESRARSYTSDLVVGQLAKGGNRYAATSLCRLAQQAKARALRSLCLEWTEKATEIAPEDGWAHGQKADAYLYYGRLNEAQEEFHRALSLGERFFGTVGAVRIRMARAEFETALQDIRKIKFEFAGEEDGYISWSHEAQILRSMWRLEEALGVYEDGVKRFPDSEVLQCGKAAVLAQLGRQREAIEAYSVCIDTLGPGVVSISGRAQALLELASKRE
jgi:tetratricopeptide (TPR) repeat protein